jgi:hypothetical protein
MAFETLDQISRSPCFGAGDLMVASGAQAEGRAEEELRIVGDEGASTARPADLALAFHNADSVDQVLFHLNKIRESLATAEA